MLAGFLLILAMLVIAITLSLTFVHFYIKALHKLSVWIDKKYGDKIRYIARGLNK